MSLLEIKNLSVEYITRKNVVHAVNGIDLHVDAGKTLGLVGETGAGKTTTALSILGLLPDPPARIAGGEIYFDGVNLLEQSDKEMCSIRGNKISMIFQDPMTALNPVLKVGDQIAEVIKLHNNCSAAEATKKSIEMLELVGIRPERSDEYPQQFSGGMKQRVVIAMGLACRPELLIADEPTTALDVTIQAQVLEMMNDLKEKFNTAMILITHDLGVVAQTCDNVAVIYAGEIVEYADKFGLFDHPSHPYTLGLFGSLPNMNEDSDRLKPINGMPPDPTNLPTGCAFSPRCPHATEACRTKHPELFEIAPGHFCRCHLTETKDAEKKEAGR